LKMRNGWCEKTMQNAEFGMQKYYCA
jgi:hypothetical protein